MKLKSAAELVEQKVGETMTYYAYPSPRTGGKSEPIILWNGSFERSEDELESLGLP